MKTEQMDTEDWRALHEEQRNAALFRLQRHSKVLMMWAEDNKAKIEFIQNHQIRIFKNGITMDFFPMSKKFHNITENRRGEYKDLRNLLNTVFDETRISRKQDTGRSKAQ